MPVADNKTIDSNGSRSQAAAQNGGSGQQKHGSSRRGGSNKRSSGKSMVRYIYFSYKQISSTIFFLAS